MTFKFKHTLAVILAVVTVACSVVGTLAVSAAETDSQPATEATVASDVTDTSVEPTQATESSQPVTEPPVTPTVSPTQPVKPNVGAIKNLKRTQYTTNSLSFKWDKVSGATGYVIYYRNNDAHKNFSRFTYVKSNACTLKKIRTATWYDVKVAAYVEHDGVKYEGKSQTYRTATLPNAVSVSLKESGAAITLSWSKNSHATGYKIYRMSGDTKGRYVLYKTITSNSITSFRDKGVKNGRAYYYQIRAYRAIKKNTYYSSPSTIRCVAGLNAVNFKTDTRLSRVNLTWGKAMTTPTAYEIFYSTSKNGKYTKLGETKNTFYNTKKLTVGKTYYFRIRAYKYSGPSSNPKKYKCLGTFQTKSVKISKNAYGVSVGNTYVEISIDQQHMWYYKNGKLVVETDVVTGNYGTSDTPKGAYSIIYKASPATLMLNSHVTFWLPFTYDGCGIHDASWRSSWEYGGTRYKGHGSHGCVNTPYSAVKKIYNNISSGTRVVVY